MGARLAQVFVFAAVAAAQSPAPGPVTRGNLLEWENSPSGGQFSVRTATHEVFRFTFDSKTYVERENQHSAIDRLKKGDLVEVVSDNLSGNLLRYARTVHVVEEQPARRPPPPPGRYRAYRSALDQVVPAGNLTFAGVVWRIDGAYLVLRTRTKGDQTIMLRQDTRYLENGLIVPVSSLALNTRVFVRGARNFEDEVEAYQVVWGGILEPENSR